MFSCKSQQFRHESMLVAVPFAHLIPLQFHLYICTSLLMHLPDMPPGDQMQLDCNQMARMKFMCAW